MSRVAVVGLGGVGGYISAHLAQTSHEIVGFARGEHLQKIKANGIKIIEDEKHWSVELDARALSEADGYFDIVLFCVKSYDLRESYKAMKPFIDSDTTIVSFSNGVSNGEVLRELSDSIVLDGCVYILSHIEKYGEVKREGKVFSAIFGGDYDASAKLKSIFDEAKLRVKVPSDIKTAIWKKYIFISAFATLTSYYDKSMGYIYEHHYEDAKRLLTEIENDAKSRGIDIFEEVEKSLHIVKNLPYNASTSMHRDYKNRRRVELESLSGYVKTPLMSKMYEELLAREF